MTPDEESMPEPEPEGPGSPAFDVADIMAMKVKLANETMDAAPLQVVMNQLADLQVKPFHNQPQRQPTPINASQRHLTANQPSYRQC